jgi:uncharacterized protein (DUF2252 family)
MPKQQEAEEVSARTTALLEEGRSLRLSVPLEAHAGWTPPAERRDPVAVLEEQAATRIPDLVPIRYGRMAESPLTFFRGSAATMAADLATTPATSLRVQSCGDAHLLNFGIFAAPDRRLVFDLNDFDETQRAPFEWDLKRLAASMAVAARDNGFGLRDQRAAARRAVRQYQKLLAEFTQIGFLEAWYTRLEVEPMIRAARAQGKDVTPVAKATAKAEKRTRLGALDRFAERVDGSFRIRPRPPVIVPVPDDQRDVVRRFVEQALKQYQKTLGAERRIVLNHYRLADIARKVSGVGSVGTEGYMVLLIGEHDDPLFLQVKQAQSSVLAPYVKLPDFHSHGERVVRGQRIMQAASDSFLGWYQVPGRDYYLRQLRDMKGGINPSKLSADNLIEYGRLCGACLARGHARSDQIARLSGYVGTDKAFARAIEDFAIAYADQNEADYRALLAAAQEGRITLQKGV